MVDFNTFWNGRFSLANPKTRIALCCAVSHTIRTHEIRTSHVFFRYSRKLLRTHLEPCVWFCEEHCGNGKTDELKFMPNHHVHFDNLFESVFSFDATPAVSTIHFDFDYRVELQGSVGSCRVFHQGTEYEEFYINVHCGAKQRTFFSVLYIVMHELCHVKQIQCDLGFMDKYDFSIPHDERSQEIEAKQFAKDQCELLKPILKEKVEAKTIYDLL